MGFSLIPEQAEMHVRPLRRHDVPAGGDLDNSGESPFFREQGAAVAVKRWLYRSTVEIERPRSND